MIDPHDLIDCNYQFGYEEHADDNWYLESESLCAFYSMLADVEYAMSVKPLEEAADNYYEKDFDLSESNEKF